MLIPPKKTVMIAAHVKTPKDTTDVPHPRVAVAPGPTRRHVKLNTAVESCVVTGEDLIRAIRNAMGED